MGGHQANDEETIMIEIDRSLTSSCKTQMDKHQLYFSIS